MESPHSQKVRSFYQKQGYKIARPLTMLDPLTGEYVAQSSAAIEAKNRELLIMDLQQKI